MVQQGLKAWRVALGFVVAPLAPSALAAVSTLADGGPNGGYGQWLALFALVGGYPATLVFGIPAYFVLSRFLRPRLIYVVLAGGVVAAAPFVLVMLFGGVADYASVGEHVTAQRGVRTFWGWIEMLKAVGLAFGLGLVGGLAFWMAAVFSPRRRVGAGEVAGVGA